MNKKKQMFNQQNGRKDPRGGNKMAERKEYDK